MDHQLAGLIIAAEKARDELTKPVNVMIKLTDQDGIDRAKMIINSELDRRAMAYLPNVIVEKMLDDAKKAQLEALDNALKKGNYTT